MTAPPIPEQRRQLAECVCGAPVPNLLVATCGQDVCIQLSNILDRAEEQRREDD